MRIAFCAERNLGGRQIREGHSEVRENANINAGHRNKAANTKRRKMLGKEVKGRERKK